MISGKSVELRAFAAVTSENGPWNKPLPCVNKAHIKSTNRNTYIASFYCQNYDFQIVRKSQ